MEHPITVILGLPGAGKSTYSRTVIPAPDLKTVRINLDDIRLMFGVAFAERLESLVWEIAFDIASIALCEGCRVVFDESVTDPKLMRDIRRFSREHRLNVHAIVVESPSYLCWKKREGTNFPREAFEQKFAEWSQHRGTIIDLCDTVEYRTGNTELLEELCKTKRNAVSD